MSKQYPKCVNVVQVDDKIHVTIRYPAGTVDARYAHDMIYEGSMQDVMLNE